MKKIMLLLLMVLVLTGCKVQQEIQLDTIVDIPLHPTEGSVGITEPTAATEASAVATEQISATEAPTEKETGGDSAGKTNTGAEGNSSTNKPGKGSSKNDGGKTNQQEPTKPTPSTEPPTQAPTESPTEAPTELQTEAPTEPPTEPKGYDVNGFAPGSLEYGVIDKINAQRAEAGLAALRTDGRLCQLAALRAYEVSISWSHIRPNGSSNASVLSEYGYGGSCQGENLYYTYGAANAGSIADKWSNSDSHRENILSEKAAAVGVGSYTASDGVVYVAAFFVG